MNDPLGPARGVFIAVVIGTALWVVAIAAWAVLVR